MTRLSASFFSYEFSEGEDLILQFPVPTTQLEIH